MSFKECFKYALACGTSNAMLKNTGDIQILEMKNLLKK